MSALAYEQLLTLDAELVRLARGLGALRLRAGEAFEALARRNGHHELGFSSLAAYARERCERSGRWAADSRALARRLFNLPNLREALRQGDLSWSMAEVLAPHITPQDEAAWLERTRGMTVREVRALVQGSDGVVEDEDEDDTHTLTVTVRRDEAWAFEAAHRAAQLAGDAVSADEVLEALLNEAHSTLCACAPADRIGELEAIDALEQQIAADRKAHAEWCATRQRWRTEAELVCEGTPGEGGPPIAPPHCDEPLPAAPEALDRLLRALCQELTERDLTMGMAAEAFRRAGGFHRLGYASEAQYARERIGVSLSSLKAKRVLATRCRRLPELADALGHGTIGYEAAFLVSRVATVATISAWIARARERTVKHLRQEIETAELLLRFGCDRDVAPPSDDLVDQMLDIERWVASGARYVNPDSQMSGGPAPGPASGDGCRSGVATVTFRWRASGRTYRYWRALEQVYARMQPLLPGAPRCFLAFVCENFCRVWVPILRRAHLAESGAPPAYFRVYTRDVFRCASPVCSRRDVTPHHLTFRSRGGGDEDENVTTLCVWCHLRGVHGGKITAKPPASRIRWRIGRNATIRVVGRRRIAA